MKHVTLIPALSFVLQHTYDLPEKDRVGVHTLRDSLVMDLMNGKLGASCSDNMRDKLEMFSDAASRLAYSV